MERRKKELRKQKRKVISVIFLILIIINWVFLYIFGTLLSILYCIHIITRTIQIEGLKKIKPYKKGVILAGNHPSLFIPALSIFFLFPIFFIKPWLIPQVTPKNEWYHKWWYIPFRLISIPVGNPGKGSEFRRAASASRFIKALEMGRIIIIFPEATRTTKAEKAGRVVYSEKGHMMGVLEGGAALIAMASGAAVIPFWSNEKYRRLPMPWNFPIKITIGDPLLFGKEISTEDAIQRLTQALLKLADQ